MAKIKIYITVTKELETVWIDVTGKTYFIRELLKALKFKWNPNAKTWSYVNSNLEFEDAIARRIMKEVLNVDADDFGLYDFGDVFFEALRALGFNIKMTKYMHDIDCSVTKYVAEIDADEKELEKKATELAEKIKQARFKRKNLVSKAVIKK